MRFLVVHQDQVSTARSMVDELDAAEIEIVVYHGENDLGPEFRERLKKDAGAELGLIGVRRKYQKVLERERDDLSCSLRFSLSSVSVVGSVLRAWLSPPELLPGELLKPVRTGRIGNRIDRQHG